MKHSPLPLRALFSGLLILTLVNPQLASADAGVLIPHDKTQPDPSVLSLAEMQVDIRIDNGDARVWVRQIFLNHTEKIEEGNYVFALPSRTTVSDFAVWDGPTRIPAVILERKRAEEIYADLKAQAIDPGLLEQGERGVEDARRNSDFSAHIVPIQPYGTKRLEIEYHQSIPVENLKSYFVLPLHPDAYQAQSAGRLRIHFELRSAQAIQNFAQQSKLFPLKICHAGCAHDRRRLRRRERQSERRPRRCLESRSGQYQPVGCPHLPQSQWRSARSGRDGAHTQSRRAGILPGVRPDRKPIRHNDGYK